jgi:PAS domain S-box-containing protein
MAGMGLVLDSRFIPLIFDNISHGIFTIDEEGRITTFNRAAEEITGYSRVEALGHHCHEVLRADHCAGACLLKHSIDTGERMEDREVTILTKRGNAVPLSICTAALMDAEGRVLGGVEMFRDLSAERELRKQLAGTWQFQDLVFKSAAMRKVVELLPLVARSGSTALIEGPSGTGKELVARAIHDLGPRSEKPFVAVNCTALPDTLLESELFGYMKGAFTDAKTDKPGRFALAEGGTLLLDEVGDLAITLQAKLLRVLETKQYEPLGGRGPIAADVRLLAATNKDLVAEVQAGRFRHDLFFRLNVIRVRLPALAERKEDIPLLVEHFITRMNRVQGRRIRRCTENALAALMAYDYPGNVRELENAIEHGFVVCAGDTIQLEDLPPHVVEARKTALTMALVASPLRRAEADEIRAALARAGGHRQKAAKELGVSRNTLWRKMKRHGIRAGE